MGVNHGDCLSRRPCPGTLHHLSSTRANEILISFKVNTNISTKISKSFLTFSWEVIFFICPLFSFLEDGIKIEQDLKFYYADAGSHTGCW